MRFHRTTALILVLVGCLALLGFKKQEAAPSPAPEVSAAPQMSVETTSATVPFKVISVELGKAIGPDKKITEPATTFGAEDTIYASVASEGTAPWVRLHAKWTFGDAGQVVKEQDLDIAPTGPATTEFHISKPSSWPVGKYKVEIMVVTGSQDFEVKK